MTESLTQAAILILTALVGLVAQRVTAWIEKRTDAETREFLFGLFDLVLDGAIEKMSGVRGDGSKMTRDEAIADAASYVARSGADALRRFGMDSDRLNAALDLRLTARGH